MPLLCEHKDCAEPQNKQRNIAVVWDFDGTLTPKDSTSSFVNHISGQSIAEFWNEVKTINKRLSSDDENAENWVKLISSDTPTWMYALSRIAFLEKKVLDSDGIAEEAASFDFDLYPEAMDLLWRIKNLSNEDEFRQANVEIHHFIVSAGLRDLISFLVGPNLFSCIWGCLYQPRQEEGVDRAESVPIMCVDETMKTRALFEISKGVWKFLDRQVNQRIDKDNYWCEFSDMIYVGDGDTDIPALAVVRDRGGLGIVVFNPKEDIQTVKERLHRIAADERADYILPADYNNGSLLEEALMGQCRRILRRYQAKDLSQI